MKRISCICFAMIFTLAACTASPPTPTGCNSEAQPKVSVTVPLETMKDLEERPKATQQSDPIVISEKVAEAIAPAEEKEAGALGDEPEETKEAMSTEGYHEENTPQTVVIPTEQTAEPPTVSTAQIPEPTELPTAPTESTSNPNEPPTTSTEPITAPAEPTTEPTDPEPEPLTAQMLRELEQAGLQYAVSQYGYEVDYSLGFGAVCGYYPGMSGYFNADGYDSLLSLVKTNVDVTTDYLMGQSGPIWGYREDNGAVWRTLINIAIVDDGDGSYTVWVFYG